MKPPWVREQGIDAVVEQWLARKVVSECIVASKDYPLKEASHAPMPGRIPHPVAATLAKKGITSLYQHQAEAYDLAMAGKSFVVATETASGKSLCFHLPILTTLFENPNARALYLFPTKALSRDQEASLRELFANARGDDAPGAIVFDGDTPSDARRAARERSAILLTNPDMLHSGILPHHASWARLFSELRYVVIDELHVYRGVFGSHLANVIRRLRRVCALHGSNPTFLAATATIGNPREHAATIMGLEEDDVHLIAQSGAPRGTRRVFVYNPPIVNKELAIRGSCHKRAVNFTADLLKAGVPTILFGGSRNGVETMLKYLREATADAHIAPESVVGYRGGYLPNMRRDIEKGLRAGKIRGVVATNALELGMDIGDLDAVVCAGYPGTIAATWQRFGRAGRRGATSLALLVTSSAPVDQYLASQPEWLLGAASEQARIDPNNLEILLSHVKCGAFEAPFFSGEKFGSLTVEETSNVLKYLRDHRLLQEVPTGDRVRFHWIAEAYPANHIALRSIAWHNVVIIERLPGEEDKTIGEMDFKAAHTMLHEQAIYQQDAAQYQVEKFDCENHKAFVRRVEPDYYTDAMTYTKVAVLEEQKAVTLGRARAAFGDVQVVEKVVGYKKIKFHTHENVGFGDVSLPELEMQTVSFWITLSELMVHELASIGISRTATADALRAIGRALIVVSSISLMCDLHDLSTVLEDRPPGATSDPFAPTLHVYDSFPGGVGLAERVFESRFEFLQKTFDLIARCACLDGCPACMGPANAPVTQPSRKDAARWVLQKLLDARAQEQPA